MKTSFNLETKQILSDKLVKAIGREKLTGKFVCDALGLEGPSREVLLSNAKNPYKLSKCPESFWSLIQKWVNSGKTIREYGVKTGSPGAFVEKTISVSPAAITLSEEKKENDFNKEKSLDFLLEQFKTDMTNSVISNIVSWCKQKAGFFPVTALEIYDRIRKTFIFDSNFIYGQSLSLKPIADKDSKIENKTILNPVSKNLISELIKEKESLTLKLIAVNKLLEIYGE